MNKTIKLIFFLLILTLNFSCFEKKSAEKDTKNNLLFGMADGSIFKFNGKDFEKQF